MRSAVIVDAVRTPTGWCGGRLSGWHPAALAAVVMNALVERHGLDPGQVNAVLMRRPHRPALDRVDLARGALRAAGWPASVSARNLGERYGSSVRALHVAARCVTAGVRDVMVAAGVSSASWHRLDQDGSDAERESGSVARNERGTGRVELGRLDREGLLAELTALRRQHLREELDGLALRSHRLASAAQKAGRFGCERVPVEARRRDLRTGSVAVGEPVTVDDGIRTMTADGLAAIEPAFFSDGLVTAGNSSMLSDGAAAALVMSEQKADELGLAPLARIVGYAVAGYDRAAGADAPTRVTRDLLAREGLLIRDIELFEISEAFAPVVLQWHTELGVPLESVNVNGGAIALGSPVGADGVRVATTLIHELRRRAGYLGLQTMYERGGGASATLFESLA